MWHLLKYDFFSMVFKCMQNSWLKHLTSSKCFKYKKSYKFSLWNSLSRNKKVYSSETLSYYLLLMKILQISYSNKCILKKNKNSYCTFTQCMLKVCSKFAQCMLIIFKVFSLQPSFAILILKQPFISCLLIKTDLS